MRFGRSSQARGTFRNCFGDDDLVVSTSTHRDGDTGDGLVDFSPLCTSHRLASVQFLEFNFGLLCFRLWKQLE